ncbi:MAG: hypothetical protein K9J27_07570 [Bacteroidales bacterium]|nr:hypothetical protein [Bacteroidales bacterium]MCF8333498.1 hypothetical protein [Bacteroidales bacterium]
MKLIKWTLAAVLFIGISSCSTFQEKNTEELEKETLNSMKTWFEESGVDDDALQESFESYFSANGIIDPSDSKADQYMDILAFMQNPGDFPPLTDKRKVTGMMDDLGISSRDVQDKKHLDYYYDYYMKNKEAVDTTSTYYVFGATIETVNKIPKLGSPALVAKTLKNQMDKADLRKELYQKTIVMFFYFDMAMHLAGE